MIRFTLDPDEPPKLTEAQRAHLDALDDVTIMASAVTDPDNQPLSSDEAGRIATAAVVRRVRKKTGLSQERFAEAFAIKLGRLRDLEQGRTRADSALFAYLTVIDREPDAVKRALRRAA